MLRGLRQAAGISQDGWAARLGYGRRTIQRWEQGLQAPDAGAAIELVQLVESLGLMRTFQQGPLAGLTIDATGLAVLLSEARLAHAEGRAPARSDPDDNLPSDLAPLIGRAWEAEELARVATTARLVTVTGMGGVGKTRLAIRVAHDLLPSFRDGAWLVELADITDMSLVPLALTHALGARELPGRAPAETIARTLRDRRLLLLLDNCEHVRDAVSLLVADLLRQSSDLHVLATSREPLGVPGEVVWPLAPLITPAEGAEATLDEISRSDAVRMFVEVARAARREFRLTAANAGDVARICRRLDGLPLAIELAAARLAVITPAELDARLSETFELLATTDATAPSRQRTLTATLDWSWALLPEDERALLARLSVFVEGCGLRAIASVCAPKDLLASLERLVNSSLVSARTDATGRETRYRLLESVRTYARERLDQRGEGSETEIRLAAWCVETASVAGGAIHGPDQAYWYHWIETEHGTIRSVMRRALDQGDTETSLELMAMLWWPWGVLGHAGEAQTWAEQSRLLSEGLPISRARVATLLAAGAFASFAGNGALAEQRLEEADGAARQLGEPEAVLSVVAQQARLLQMTGRFDEATLLAARGLALVEPAQDGWVAGRLLEMQAHAALRAGQPGEAGVALAQALALARNDGDAWGTATVLAELGDLARSEGRFAEAESRYRKSLTLREGLGIPGSTPSLHQNRGFVALASRDRSRAKASFDRAFEGFHRAGDIRGMAECAIGYAGLAMLAGAPGAAARMIGWAEASLQAADTDVWPSTRNDLASTIAAGQAALGPARWDDERAAGTRLAYDEIRQLAHAQAVEVDAGASSQQ